MKVTYSDHAREKMVERGISEAEVEEMLAGGYTETEQPSPRPGASPRRVLWGRAGARRLKVVLVGADIPVIVTAACPDE